MTAGLLKGLTVEGVARKPCNGTGVLKEGLARKPWIGTIGLGFSQFLILTAPACTRYPDLVAVVGGGNVVLNTTAGSSAEGEVVE